MSSPIRVGIIGLSQASWSTVAHAPYLVASDKYEIVAIANTSVESAQKTIKMLNLPESTKAYANPDGL